MARPLRVEQAGYWYHVTARSTERRDIFRDDTDRRKFLALLAQAVGMFALRLHVYVLMRNHYHLIIELTEPNLSRAMQWLNISYTVWFNQRYGRSGHLFRGRFKSVVVDPGQWGLELSRYVHLNPVRPRRLGPGKGEGQPSRSGGAGRADRKQVQARLRTLRGYKWSSFGAYIGAAKKPEWLTTEGVLTLGGRTANSPERYWAYSEEAIRQGEIESPWGNVIRQTVLGSPAFVAGLKRETGKTKAAKERQQRPGWDQVVRAVEKVRGEKWREFRDRYGDPGRDLVLYLGRTRCGLSQAELSKRAAIQYMSASAAVRRFTNRVRQDPKTSELVQRALRHL